MVLRPKNSRRRTRRGGGKAEAVAAGTGQRQRTGQGRDKAEADDGLMFTVQVVVLCSGSTPGWQHIAQFRLAVCYGSPTGIPDGL